MGEINYAYDANGRTEAMWGSYARLDLPEALKSTEYNAANELIEREGKELSYDEDGNLTADGSNEYDWDARGQLTKISGANTPALATTRSDDVSPRRWAGRRPNSSMTAPTWSRNRSKAKSRRICSLA